MSASLSLVSASVVGVLSAPPVFPLVLVTIVTRLVVLWLLDLVLHGLEVMGAAVMRTLAGLMPDALTIPDSMQHAPPRPPVPGSDPSP